MVKKKYILFMFWAFAGAALARAQEARAEGHENQSSQFVGPTLTAKVSQDDLDGWLNFWQQLLDLKDWAITVRAVRATALKPDTLGNLKWWAASKIANVSVLDPQDYDLPPNRIPADIEYTIVHELVHLQLAALPRTTNTVEEGIVNKISRALIGLRDEKKPRTTGKEPPRGTFKTPAIPPAPAP